MVEKRVTEMRKILKEDVPDWLLEVNISYRDLIKENFSDAIVVSAEQRRAFTKLLSLSKNLSKCTDAHCKVIEERYLKQQSVKTMMRKMMVSHSHYYNMENESLLELSERFL